MTRARKVAEQPLCNGGKCSQILIAIAEAKTLEGVVRMHGEVLSDVIRAVVDVMNPTAEQRAAAHAELGRQVDRIGRKGEPGGGS